MDNKQKRHEIIVRIVCVLMAFSLWLYVTNVKNPLKTVTIRNVPVSIQNEQSLKDFGLALVQNQDLTVDLEVEGPVTEVFTVDKDSFRVAIDLSKYALKKGENKILVDLLDYPSTLTVRNSASLKVTIKVDSLVERSFEITPSIKVTPKTGYYSGEPDIKTKSVTVSGPAETVNKVSKVIATGEINDVDGDINQKFPLKILTADNKELSGLTLSKDDVDVFIPIRKAKPVKVNVKTTGVLTDDYMLDYIIPDNTYVELIGEEDSLKNISYINTSPIDLTKITASTNVSANLEVPDGVLVVNDISKVNVKVGISKKATKEINVIYAFKGLSPDFNVETDQEVTRVVIKGSQDNLNKINKDNIKCEVLLSDYGEGEYEIEPKVTLPNENVELVSVEKVKVKILKK